MQLKKAIAQLKETIESCRQAAELARNKETERAKLADEARIELERLVADRQAKNLALYKIASEILQRYEQFGLGDALRAREPFVGITRVKLQNLVQDYQDKLLNERTTLERRIWNLIGTSFGISRRKLQNPVHEARTNFRMNGPP